MKNFAMGAALLLVAITGFSCGDDDSSTEATATNNATCTFEGEDGSKMCHLHPAITETGVSFAKSACDNRSSTPTAGCSNISKLP